MDKRPCAFSGQSLLEHLEGSVNIAKSFVNNYSYSKVVYSRIKPFIQGLREEDVLNGIYSTVFLHDIGKAVERYQEPFDDSCNAKASFNFMHHEIFSSAIAYEVLSGNNGSSFDELLGYVVLAIMMHHEAMRIVNPNEKIVERLKVTEERILGIEKLLEKMLALIPGIKVKRVEFIDRKILDNFERWLGVVSNTSKNIKMENRRLNLYTFFELPLIISDNLDSRRRGDEGRRRKFIAELEREVVL
ncbi:MAG: CRISPR-associated endonuclease Cas3'' [Caldisphaeraceae archaeon]|nr:CRISPR-associated endonuclease Cas3'' [Caldisphaeraceae archaeon]